MIGVDEMSNVRVVILDTARLKKRYWFRKGQPKKIYLMFPILDHSKYNVVSQSRVFSKSEREPQINPTFNDLRREQNNARSSLITARMWSFIFI